MLQKQIHTPRLKCIKNTLEFGNFHLVFEQFEQQARTPHTPHIHAVYSCAVSSYSHSHTVTRSLTCQLKKVPFNVSVGKENGVAV